MFIAAVTKNFSRDKYKFEWEVDNCDSHISNFVQCELPIDCNKCALIDQTKDFIILNISNCIVKQGVIPLNIIVKSITTNSILIKLGIKLNVEPLPISHEFNINPEVGYGWETIFKLSMDNSYSTTYEDLYYEFIYMHPSEHIFIPLSMKTRSNRMEVRLPAGLPRENYKLTLGVRIYNANGGWIEITKTIISMNSPNNKMSIFEHYDQLKFDTDMHNPSSAISYLLLTTYLLTDKPDSISDIEDNIVKCNSNGIYVNGKCFCDLFYQNRIDCSISYERLLQEIELANDLLLTLENVLKNEPSNLKYKAVAQIVTNIAIKEDLLSDPVKALAKDLLIKTMNEGIFVNDQLLAQTINNIMIPSEDVNINEDRKSVV